MTLSNLFDKPWWKVVKWLIVLAAYGYMAYQLAMYDDYASLWATLNSKLSTLNLILALALMPLNIFLEAVKWRCLTRDLEPMSLREAQSQVYCGFVGAFITPYRVGDFPARAMYIKDKSHWGSATLMGFVGGVALTLVIILVGLIPAVFYFDQSPAWWEVVLTLVGCLAVGLLTPYLIYKRKGGEAERQKGGEAERQKQDTRHQTPDAHSTPLLPATGWSLLRYLVFSLQLYLLLRWVGVALSPEEALVAIPFYYLLVTLTPNMPVADVGIRGSWAIFVFGRYGEVPLITAAVVVLYTINTLLPTLIGSVITLCRKS